MNAIAATYTAKRRFTIAETPTLRVRQLELLDGQQVPWHHHTRVVDTFVCLSGPMLIETRTPNEFHRLEAGGLYAVEPGTAHRVTAVTSFGCRFLVIQGIGTYDYVPECDLAEATASV